MDPDECRRRASDCVARARTMLNPANRLQLLIIARAWLKLADRAAAGPAVVPVSDIDLPDDESPPDSSPTSA